MACLCECFGQRLRLTKCSKSLCNIDNTSELIVPSGGSNSD